MAALTDGVMTDASESQYARSADGTNLAYQVSGDGPLDLVFVHVAPPIDLLPEDPGFVRVRRRLGSFSRTVWFDHRGMGSSEGDPREATAGDTFDADLVAIFDAVGFERAALVGEGISGGRAIHFAATHPDRVSALVLLNAFARYTPDDDYPFGLPPDSLDERIVGIENERWVTSLRLDLLAPSRASDQRFREFFVRTARLRGGPKETGDLVRAIFQQDVRPLLPSILVPTLVVHREGNRWVEVGAGRYLAEHLPNAKLVVLPGDDHAFFVGDTDAWVDEIEDFLTGARSGGEGDVLTMTVLFTDIVASTEHQARVGPREWSRLTDHHDAMVRAALSHHRGHEVKTTGDGFLATFDATGRALRCAAEIVAGAKDIGLHLRAGVHTGEVEVRGDDIAGLAVTIAKRVCDLAAPGQVLVSETVRGQMVGSRIEFNDEGQHDLKGVPGPWRLFSIED
jgi:class 3 adenylate cyclase/pimeloyl-ACP methyl ester carboxylesterase